MLTKDVVPYPVSTVCNAGAVKTPIKTQRGWPHIQHGVYPTMAGTVYRLGVALGDLADPARLQGRGRQVAPRTRGLLGGGDTVMCAGPWRPTRPDRDPQILEKTVAA